jgi:hypothetical protein
MRDLEIEKKVVGWALLGVVTVLLAWFVGLFGWALGLLSWWVGLSLFGAGFVAALVMFGVSSYHSRRG